MKSPRELSKKLARQWSAANHREQRLLSEYQWPLRLSIDRPSAHEFKNTPGQVREHQQRI